MKEYEMESTFDSLSAVDLILQARLLLGLIFRPSSCLAVLLNWQAFYKTRRADRLMYFTSAGLVDLPSEAAETIKQCFQHRSLATRAEICGIPVVVNLLGMVMADSEGRLLSLAWVDPDGKLFVPKEVHYVGIRRIMPTPADPRPSFGSLEDLQRLEETNGLYKQVVNTFLRGMKVLDQGARVTAIYSCTHRSAFAKSRLRAFEWTQEVTKAFFGNECYGWYGTSAKKTEAIISRGFGSKDANLGCGAYGSGIYLAARDHSRVSALHAMPDTHGECHVLLNQVILGRVEKIERGSTQYLPSNEGYDNGVNELNNPSCYIIWTSNMSTHIIPRFVVSFKVSQELEGQWKSKQILANHLRGLTRPIPLPSPDPALLARRPGNLERYRRNKNQFL